MMTKNIEHHCMTTFGNLSYQFPRNHHISCDTNKSKQTENKGENKGVWWLPDYSLCCSLPVPLSLADTLTMPLASMSKVTSICGTPRGAGGIPTCYKNFSSQRTHHLFLKPNPKSFCFHPGVCACV